MSAPRIPDSTPAILRPSAAELIAKGEKKIKVIEDQITQIESQFPHYERLRKLEIEWEELKEMLAATESKEEAPDKREMANKHELNQLGNPLHDRIVEIFTEKSA